MTKKERQRIAREYGVEVPADVSVQKIPKGKTSMPATMSRHEALARARRVLVRGWKFQAAERKRNKEARENANTDKAD